MNTASLGKVFLIFGVVITLLGVIMLVYDKIPFVGKLPGDIFIKRKNFSFYFPLGTSILLSVILTILFFIISVFKK